MAAKTKKKRETKAQLAEKDRVARELIDSLTVRQRYELAIMLGMSNLGQSVNDRPSEIAEDDEMYDMFMGEIDEWHDRLKNPEIEWGWCSDLMELVRKAVRRCPDLRK
jgi:hypothetical protein